MLTYGNHFVGNNYFLSSFQDFDNNYQVYFGKEGYVYLSASATSGDLFPNPIVDDYRYTLSKTGEKLQFSNIIGTGDNQRVYVQAEYGISVKPEYVNEIYTGDKTGYWYNERNIWSNAILDENTSTTQTTYKFHRFNNFDTLEDLSHLKYKLNWTYTQGTYNHQWSSFNDVKNLKSSFGRFPMSSTAPNDILWWNGLQNLEYCTEMFENTYLEKIPRDWDFPKLKTAEYMFWCDYELRKIPNTWYISTYIDSISGSATYAGLSALENANHMFDGTNISALPSRWFGLENLTAANFMFYDVGNAIAPTADDYRLTAIPTSWNGLSSLKQAQGMFADVSSLLKIPSSFEYLGALEIMPWMFSGTNLSASKITSWEGLEKVWDAGVAFRDTNLSSIPTSWAGLGTNLQYHINSAKPFPESTTVLDCTNMFRDSDITAIPTVWPSEWLNYNKTTDCFIIDLEMMFKNCTGLTQSVKPLMDQITAHQTNWYERGKCRIDYNGMFQGCTNIADRSLSSQSAYSAFFSSYYD